MESFKLCLKIERKQNFKKRGGIVAYAQVQPHKFTHSVHTKFILDELACLGASGRHLNCHLDDIEHR